MRLDDDDKIRWRVPVTLVVTESHIKWHASLFDSDAEPSPAEVAEYMEERLCDQLPQFDVEIDQDAPERVVLSGAPS